MPDDLDDLLGAVPAAPLPGAAVARARGNRRTRRARAALAGAGAALAVLAVTGATALAGGGPDTLPVATTPTLMPSPTPTPSAPPAPAPPSPREELLAVEPSLLLDASAVAAAVGGTWAAGSDTDLVHPLVFACPDGGQPAERGLLRTLTGPGDALVSSQLLAYPGLDAAAEALERIRADALRCPSRPEDSEDGRASASHVLLSGATTDWVIVEQTARDCDGCPERVRTYGLARVANLVTLVAADTAGDVPALLDAALSRIANRGEALPAAPSAAPSPAPSAAPAWWLPDAFLPPEKASAAEQPGWAVQDSYEPANAPLLAPCGEDVEPVADRVAESGERAMGSRREHGGSELVQEVYRYGDPRSAERAFGLYEEALRRCPEQQTQNGTERSTVVEGGSTPSYEGMLVRTVPCQQGGCADHFAVYVVVARAGDAVTVARYAIAEDGDPADDARALAIAIEEHLRDVAL